MENGEMEFYLWRMEKLHFYLWRMGEWTPPHDTINYSIPGFHPIIYRTRTDSTRSRGGVALYISEQLLLNIRDDLSKFIPNVE